MQKSKPLDPRCGIYTITPADAETLLTDPGAKNRPLAASRVTRSFLPRRWAPRGF